MKEAIPGIEIVVDIDGVRLTARAAEGETAHRPKLLVIPGSYGEAARLAPSLAKGFGDAFDWLCPDMHASRPDADFGDWRLETAADLLGKLAQTYFKGQPYGVLGISIGGIVAAHLAAARPDAVRALAYDDPSVLTAQQWHVRSQIGGLIADMPAGEWRARCEEFARRALGFDPGTGGIFPLDHTGIFARVTAPTLIVCGDVPLMPERTVDGMITYFDHESEAQLRAAYRGPFLSVQRIAGLGHWCLVMAPEACGPIYADFFAAHLPGAAHLAPGETALATRGLEHAKAGRVAAAFGDFRRLLALRPGDAGIAWFAAAMALQAGDQRAALAPLLAACADSVTPPPKTGFERSKPCCAARPPAHTKPIVTPRERSCAPSRTTNRFCAPIWRLCHRRTIRWATPFSWRRSIGPDTRRARAHRSLMPAPSPCGSSARRTRHAGLRAIMSMLGLRKPQT